MRTRLLHHWTLDKPNLIRIWTHPFLQVVSCMKREVFAAEEKIFDRLRYHLIIETNQSENQYALSVKALVNGPIKIVVVRLILGDTD